MKTAWLGIFVGTALSFQTCPSLAQTVGPNLNLTKAAGNQNETAVAINPSDNNQAFVVSRNEVGGLYTARTRDGGATWTSQLIARSTSPPAGDVPRAYGNASVAWDSLGNLFLAYLSQSSATPTTYVSLALSTDGGATFYSPTGAGSILMLPANPPNQPVIGDQPTVTVGPGSAGFRGSVWVTYWMQGGIAVSGAGVSGRGAVGPFTSLQPAQPAGVNFGDIAVGPNGEVIITYGPNSGSSGNIYTDVKPDGLGPGSFSSFIRAVPVNIGGFTPIPAQPNWGIDPEAGLAWDRSTGPYQARVYLVYTDAPAVGSADTNVFVIHSDDMGATWSIPVRVNDDKGTNSQFLPRISVDQTNGMIAVTWYDARDSALNNTARYYGAFSSDGGATFSPNFPISAGTSNQASSHAALKKTDYGDYTGSAVANGRLIAAWADNSNSTGDNPDGATNFDVYAAVVQASNTAQPVTFDFDAGTPTLTTPQGTPFDQTLGGIAAHFSSSAGAAVSVQNDAAMGWTLSPISGNYLYASNMSAQPLGIKFSQPLTGIILAFATADLQRGSVPTTIRLTAYMDSDATPPVGSAAAHGVFTLDSLPSGTLSFRSVSQPFNFVEISIPPQPLAAAGFVVDNISVTPAPTAVSVVSAASLAAGASLAPNSIAHAVGPNLAPASQTANALPLPSSLANTTVAVKDSLGAERSAALYFVAPAMIDFVVPDGTASGLATVTVSTKSQPIATASVTIEPVAPGLFTANGTGQGVPSARTATVAPGGAQTTRSAAICSKGAGNCVPAPVDLGPSGTEVVLALYGTGIRGLTSLAAVTAMIGGVNSVVQSAGATAQSPGLEQVNILLPRTLAGRGEVDLILTVDGKTANLVRVAIK